jgi:hypothetical protein
MGRIIVTVLLGFLQVGRLTSILVFIYVFAANFFFLASLLFLVQFIADHLAALTQICPLARPISNVGRYFCYFISFSEIEEDTFLVYPRFFAGTLDGVVI